MNHEEQNYLDMLERIVKHGSQRDDRTGVGTFGIFGTHLRFSLENGKIPMLTTKKTFVKGIIEELLFFLRGETDTKILEAKGVNIWKGNTTREFLDKRGLEHLPEGHMGKMYGHQWRRFGAHDEIVDYESGAYESTPTGIDQIKNTIDLIKTDPYSRRIVVCTWNAKDLDKMCLAPCHPLFQFYVDGGKLSCQFYTVGMEAKEVIFAGGDTHIYLNHVDQIKEQITRVPFEFPTLKINKNLSSIEDIESLDFSDFVIENYNCHPPIKMDMAI